MRRKYANSIFVAIGQKNDLGFLLVEAAWLRWPDQDKAFGEDEIGASAEGLQTWFSLKQSIDAPNLQ
ncbi:MAG: hypothetical protein ACON4O_04150 [Lentimonas sp.]